MTTQKYQDQDQGTGPVLTRDQDQNHLVSGTKTRTGSETGTKNRTGQAK